MKITWRIIDYILIVDLWTLSSDVMTLIDQDSSEDEDDNDDDEDEDDEEDDWSRVLFLLP